MTADPNGWSEPRLVQVNEPTDTLPEPAPEPEPEGAQQLEAEPEPAPEPEAEAEPEPEPEPPPARPAFPAFPAFPAARLLVTRRPRAVYPAGSQPPWEDKLVQRVADVAVVAMPIPLRVLDVGCGDARMLSELILRIPNAELYVGLDPRLEAVPDSVRAAEPRLSVVQAAAEALPLPDASFDLVLASMSLTLWLDQAAGAAELARVVSDNGKVVIIEGRKPQLSGRNRVHSVKEITTLLESAGLTVERVETVLRSATQVSLAHAFIASP